MIDYIKSTLGFKKKDFASFGEFYPYYLDEVKNPTNRRLHVIGVTLALICMIMGHFLSFKYYLMAPMFCVGLAAIGHWLFEKNKPGNFSHPIYSAMADLKLWFETLTRKRAW